MSNGLWLVIGILASLLSKERDEPVRHLEAALVDAGMALIPWQAAGGMMTGEAPPRRGASHGLGAPQDVYQAADSPLFVVAANQRLWCRLVDVLGAPELAKDERFAEPAGRVANEAELKVLLNGYFAGDTASAWVERLTAASVPASMLLSVDQATAHPIRTEREWIEDLQGLPNVRFPVLADHASLRTTRAAPAYGEQTAAILAQLGYDEATIGRLVKEKVVATGS